MGLLAIIILLLAIPIQNGRDIQNIRKRDNDPNCYFKSDTWMREHGYHYDDWLHIVDKNGNPVKL